MILSFFLGHGAEWSKIFLYGQLDHAKMSRIVQELDAASAGKAHNGQICICLKLDWAEKKGRDKSCVTQPIELCASQDGQELSRVGIVLGGDSRSCKKHKCPKFLKRLKLHDPIVS